MNSHSIIPEVKICIKDFPYILNRKDKMYIISVFWPKQYLNLYKSFKENIELK